MRGLLLLGGLVALGAAGSFPLALRFGGGAEVELWAAEPGHALPARSHRRLRIFQLNVFHDYPRFAEASRRIEDLEQLLEEADADVVVLQEAWSTPRRENLARRLGRRLGFHVAYARANGSQPLLGFEEGEAVLSRYPIAQTQLLELAPRKHALDRRVALLVDIQVPATAPLRVVATHLANGAPDVSTAQARDLVRQLGAAPHDVSAQVLAGDLNAGPQSPALRLLEAAGWRTVRSGERDHLMVHEASRSWRPLWSEWLDVRPNGGATASGSADTAVVASSAGSGHWLSDHPAIVAELERAGAPQASRWRGSWERSARVSESSVALAAIKRAVGAIGANEGVESVLVVHDGALIAERYYRGATRERLQNMKSASKSVLSALVGIAVGQGLLSLDDPISKYLPEARALEDPRKAAITVRDLLTMRSGLESTSFDNYGAWASSRNLVRAALEQPLQSEPGTDFAYSTGNTHLVSAVLTAATGRSTLDFAREVLFVPLGIERVAWDRDRQGIYLGGNNLAMRPRDMARFGLLYLDRGRWGDRQLVPWEWVDASTTSRFPGWRRGWGGGYGYLWWVRGPEDRGAYNAAGFGGQYIFISRAEDLVVVVTSTEVSKGRGWRRDLFEEIRDGIVAPIRGLHGSLPRPEASVAGAL